MVGYRVKKEWVRERKKLVEGRDKLVNCFQSQFDREMCKATADITETLRAHFTKTHRDVMLQMKTVHKWDEEDISKALTLRSLSPCTYKYLREKVKLPLPSIFTLNRWLSKLIVEPGLLMPIMQLLENKGASMTELDRLCVFSLVLVRQVLLESGLMTNQLIPFMHQNLEFSVVC